MLRKFERCPLIPPPEILSSGKPAPFTLPGSPGSSKVRKFEFHNSICRFIQSYFNSHFGALVDVSADLRQEVESQTPTKRLTKSIRLSRFAAHNAFHHCEQCHAYCEAGPAAQVRPSMPPPPCRGAFVIPSGKNTSGLQLSECTFHAFTFSSSMLGEEVQLQFFIPKAKEKHFVFSQEGSHLECLRLPLVSTKVCFALSPHLVMFRVPLPSSFDPFSRRFF